MSWVAVARKDFQDSIRSRTLLIVIAVFVLLLGAMTYLVTWFEPVDFSDGMSAEAYTGLVLIILSGNFPFVPSPVPAILPIIGLLLGYKAIVGERESGQLKFLLGLPHSRLDVVVGKLAGRALVGAIAALSGIFVMMLLLVLSGSGGLALGPFVRFTLVTIVFVLVHVSIGISISAAVPTSGWATGVVLLLIGVFQIAWGAAFTILSFVAFEEGTPNWFEFLESLRPAAAYEGALNFIVFQPLERSLAEADPTSAPLPEASEVFYLSDWFGLVILLGWVLVPLAIGYALFYRADLG